MSTEIGTSTSSVVGKFSTEVPIPKPRFDRLKEQTYEYETIQLDSNLNNQLFSIEGDFIEVVYLSKDVATCTIKLDRNTNPAIDLNRVKNLRGPFQRFFLTTTSIAGTTNAGKTLILFIGRAGAAEAYSQIQAVNVLGQAQLVYCKLLDAAGTGNYFETDEAMGATPTLYMSLVPSDVERFVLDEISYRMEAANAVTFQLYLLEDASADDLTQLSDVIFDSGAAQARNTTYNISPTGAHTTLVPRNVKLATAGKLYYMIDWSGAPGNTPGFIYIKGRKLY